MDNGPGQGVKKTRRWEQNAAKSVLRTGGIHKRWVKSLRDEIRLTAGDRTDFISSAVRISSAQQISSLREQGFRSVRGAQRLGLPTGGLSSEARLGSLCVSKLHNVSVE